ncbi:MAG: amidohydrolase [Acidobacteria bacterium]|nr:amidohydrolase [Acidobacteriota bacterium]
MRRVTTALLLVGSLGLVGHGDASATAPQAPDAFAHRLEAARSELIAFRRDLHMNPEVSGEEVRTAAAVSDRLEALGLEVRRGVGGHGVVATLSGALPGPTVAFRADLDAVYSDAPDPVDFASVRPGVRHICGHDIHTTIGVALAEGFAAMRASLPGTVVFVFQPAEERANGAEAMLADEAFGDVEPEAIFAFHTAPMQTGVVALAREAMMPGRDAVAFNVRGASDYREIERELSRGVSAASTVVNPGANQPVGSDFISAQYGGGQATGNDGWRFGAVVTRSTENARIAAEAAMAAIASDIESRYPGTEISVEYDAGWVAGVTNDPELAAHAAASAGRVLGEDNVAWLQTMVPAFSEDFGSFQRHMPGVMFFLGVSNADRGWVGMPHSPGYVADEEAIFVGARAMAAVMLDAMTQSW